MTKPARKIVLIAVAIATGVTGLFLNEEVVPGVSLVSEAQAIIGRPLTPLSYAGVARRTVRRTVRRCAVGVYYC